MSKPSSPLASHAVVRDPVTPISIVIADDYELWRNQVRELLQTRPEWYIAGEACDGSEAVQKVQELQPDVVILDIAMPRVNGIEAATKIRNHSPKSRIIFLTEFADKDIRDAAFRVGAVAYVTKSKASQELVKAIANAVISVQ